MSKRLSREVLRRREALKFAMKHLKRDSFIESPEDVVAVATHFLRFLKTGGAV